MKAGSQYDGSMGMAFSDLLAARLREPGSFQWSNAWVTRCPKAEAHDLYRMVRYGNCSIVGIRELITVPPNVQATLRAFAHQYPEDAPYIERVLRFREQVATEFERIVDTVSPTVVEENAVTACA